MTKGRKSISKKVEEKKVEVLQDQMTDSVTVKEENIVIPEVKEENKLFTMDIREFGVKFEDAEKFVNNAIRFYIENKDKKLFDELELEKMKEFIESKSNNKGDKFEESLQKIKKFEDQIKMNQFIPKRTVLDFLKDLKG